jgi:hypothetical protein
MSLAPAQFSEPMYEPGQQRLPFRIIFVAGHQYADAPHI